MPVMRFWRCSSVSASLLLVGTGLCFASDPALGSMAHQTGSPTIFSFQAMANSSTSATFQASLSPSGADTTYVFDYGLTTTYGQTTPTQDAGSGFSLVTVTAQVTGLLPNTSYHYRIVATNGAGSAASPDGTVITTSSSSQTTARNSVTVQVSEATLAIRQAALLWRSFEKSARPARL